MPSPRSSRRLIRLSDGGHSENLGAYVLLRRRCRTIVVVDSEYDPTFQFPSWRRLVRAAADELEADITVPQIDSVSATERPAVMIGTIGYSDGSAGSIVYVKLALDPALGEMPADVVAYRRDHPCDPQESTADQHFPPDRFRAYRALGEVHGRIAAAHLEPPD